MTDQERKLEVAARIAHEFAEADIHWAVGGSLLLYFHGLCNIFHDLDLMVDEKDICQAEKILLSMHAVKEEAAVNSSYKTKYFYEFCLDDVEIDMMAGMIIVENGIEHDCSFQPDHIVQYASIQKERIPLYSLQEWRCFYQWMGREQKVKIIDAAERCL